MEMIRQRIRFGVVESSTHKCPVCEGTGLVRSTESLALMIMRHIEDHVLRRQGQSINVRVPVDVALYILNFKRETLTALEMRNHLSITITADGKMTGHQFSIEKGEARVMSYADQRATEHVRVDSAVIDDDLDDGIIDESEDETAEDAIVPSAAESGEGESGRRRRRRRRRGGADRGDDRSQQRSAQAHRAEGDLDGETGEQADESEDVGENEARPSDTAADAEGRKRRRRGRRGGRRNRRDAEESFVELASSPTSEEGLTPEASEAVAQELLAQDAVAAAPEPMSDQEHAIEAEAPVEKPKRTRRKKVAETAESAPPETEPVDATAADPAAEEKPKRKPRTRKPKAEAAEAAPPVEVSEAAPVAEPAAPLEPETAPPTDEAPKSRRVKKELPAEGIVVSSSAPKAEGEGEQTDPPKKKAGWWQRRLGLG
jgi:ribonuclease E